MNDLTTVQLWAVPAYTIGGLVQTIFILSWGKIFQWRDSDSYVGKAFYFKSTAIAIVFDAVWATLLFPIPHGQVIRVGCVYLVTIGIVVQYIAFLKKRKAIKQELAFSSYEHQGDPNATT